MNNLLSHIENPYDLRKLAPNELPQLAEELRQYIIDIVSQKEGHLGASLGVVELTIALHYVFDTPNDCLVWDVGHQAYGHKILTERRTQFPTYREKGGISGFPKRSESKYDTFGVGHSSTSISAALGMALAAQIKGEFDKNHIAIIGDASIASGMAFEALNHAGVTNANVLVILNDNSMGIDPSVGAFKEYLTAIKSGKNPIENNVIKSLNFDYTGPIDGHDLEALVTELKRLKETKGPKFLHIITTKGKGLAYAEEDQLTYHAPGKFDKLTGKLIRDENENPAPKFQDVFGHTLVELATTNEKIVGITPAMPSGSSLKYMMEAFPERAFDVGIAEQHAVTLAAGMAAQNLVVFCNIYSTFMQRAYDQVIHDVALQNLPVIFCLDRAGFVGEDGATHHGLFDIAYLSCIPNMFIYAPLNEIDLRNILYTASLGLQHPIAIRYPRGKGTITNWKLPFEKIEIGKIRTLKEGKKYAVISTGTISNTVENALIKSDSPENFAHYHLGWIKPIDEEQLHHIFTKFSIVVTVEEGVLSGGMGNTINTFASKNNYKNKIINCGVPDTFIEHGTVKQLFEEVKLDTESFIKIFNNLNHD
ncbi:1-deoxy-D-xylulose-5-phosphate synthase [Flavobacterium sp. 20NA77.7]|uniref:1-deoxy-D-xylulose-5-phosphate synthase n=1 Tax=Flavobacterium nakdongensis TaxID=3073563 RepID=A0ABY9R8L7_9FLAO|nr:1-deoxy-D-xylulose-5-phosphate synthase [Flavobacterium sp. 20NA77.7]WMW77600.1 1-deoxy-D-xylulose-5-phosphate synthase [Flavobacterium sp. 20NA77.7]